MINLYKRNAAGKPLVWSIDELTYGTTGDYKERKKYLQISYGIVGGKLHREHVQITLTNVKEAESRINAKRKEGYKELSELKDSSGHEAKIFNTDTSMLVHYLETYLPKYSTTSEGFVLPMLAKVLEDNKPFEKYGTMLGQWKIDGLRCIIGAEKNDMDLFNPVILTYHSRTGEDWTPKMKWMDEILLPNISKELLDMMIEEGACLDGELYLPGYAVNDINSFVKNTGLPQHYQLQYWCYDICCENMSAEARDKFRIENLNVPQLILNSKELHLNNTQQLVKLPTWRITNNGTSTQGFNFAMSIRDDFISYGFEGLILRNPAAEYQFGKRNQAMFKFKKVDDGKFIIVDIKSEHKRSDLPLFVLRNDINDELFECSINKTQDVQREILTNKEKYVGKYAIVEYRNRSGVSQVPFHARIRDIENCI